MPQQVLPQHPLGQQPAVAQHPAEQSVTFGVGTGAADRPARDTSEISAKRNMM